MGHPPSPHLDVVAAPATGVLAALPAELGTLRSGAARTARVAGQTLHETRLEDGSCVLAAVSGVGKVAAAAAAAALVAEGIGRLLVVGTCGGLRGADEVGDLVHATVAVQWDLAVREGREIAADPALSRAWADVAASGPAAFLTADRPAIRAVERLRRARAARRFTDGTVVADMETAAAAAVAERSGVPWAALRVVSDRRQRWIDLIRPTSRRNASFAEGFRKHAARPSETVLELLERLSEARASSAK
ncbi:MAG: hypothetical protein AAGI22_16810 [Planctomycetota bacterium]